MSADVIEAETYIIRTLANLPSTAEIVLHDGGWDSRVYSFDDGRYFFKFPRTEKARASYGLEVAALKLASRLETAIAIPKVVWEGRDGAYFGYEGVRGVPLNAVAAKLDDAERRSLGTSIGAFLKQFGELNLPEAPVLRAAEEAAQLQGWHADILPAVQEVFTEEECQKLKSLIFERFPAAIADLGTDVRLCHGDLAMWNLVYDEGGRPGIIDFGKACYSDVSRDLAYIGDEIITEYAIQSYGESPELVKKVTARRVIPAMNSFMYGVGKGSKQGAFQAAERLRQLL